MPELDALIATLEPLALPRRVARLRTVLAARTRQVSFVFENVLDTRNASACLRTLDALGFQEAHLVRPHRDEHPDPARLNRLITRGVDRWLTVRHWANTPETLAHLKARGYRVLASHLREDGQDLEEIDFSTPVALVFGNEHLGVSPPALALAQGAFRIPMRGMVESYNVSVAVALAAHHARAQIERLASGHGGPGAHTQGELTGSPYALPEGEARLIYAHWLTQTVAHSRAILSRSGVNLPEKFLEYPDTLK